LPTNKDYRNLTENSACTNTADSAARGEIQSHAPITRSGDELPFIRQDTLPENAQYPQDGCDVATSCLVCPLEVCKLDMAISVQSRQARVKQVHQLRADAVPVAVIAKRLGIGTRTVHRLSNDSPDRIPNDRTDDDNPKWNREIVQYGHTLYFNACPECKGTVSFGWDPFDRANVMNCVSCAWHFYGKYSTRQKGAV